MQQKGICLSPMAFEVIGHHREPPLAEDLPHDHHHSHHFNHGRVQHGESQKAPTGQGPLARGLADSDKVTVFTLQRMIAAIPLSFSILIPQEGAHSPGQAQSQ